MKYSKLIANLLFVLTIISLPLTFSISAIIGEANIFGVAGIVRYAWIMLLCLPIGILTLLVGLQLKKAGHPYRKLLIVAGICIPLMLIFGSYRFIFREISFEPSDMLVVEEKISFDLPDSIKVATYDYGEYRMSRVKILDKNEADGFLNKINTNACWTSDLSYASKGMLPFDLQPELAQFDYFLLYNIMTGEYNTCPDADEYKCVFIAYDRELQLMVILDDYAGTVNSYQ